MICVCGCEATSYQLPHPYDSRPIELHRCPECKRQMENGQWVRMAGFCDGCNDPTWRTVTHPRWGHDILLWPDPATIFAHIATPDGPGQYAIRDYCADCYPRLGTTPEKTICEAGGVLMNTGACDGHETARSRHVYHFSEAYGAWLRVWVFDGLHLDATAGQAVIDQWEQDRGAGNSDAREKRRVVTENE